jgi:hypothetical protein
METSTFSPTSTDATTGTVTYDAGAASMSDAAADIGNLVRGTTHNASATFGLTLSGGNPIPPNAVIQAIRFVCVNSALMVTSTTGIKTFRLVAVGSDLDGIFGVILTRSAGSLVTVSNAGTVATDIGVTPADMALGPTVDGVALKAISTGTAGTTTWTFDKIYMEVDWLPTSGQAMLLGRGI